MEKLILGTQNRTLRSPGSTLSSLSYDGELTLELFNRVIEAIKSHSVNPRTRKAYHSVWCRFNSFLIRFDHLPDKWEDRIILYAAYLADTGKASATVKSYVSAIRHVLRFDGIDIGDTNFQLPTIVRACKLNNDKLTLRMPIQKRMLSMILRTIEDHYQSINQPYLAILYKAMMVVGYYGLLRVGELTNGPHGIKANDLLIARNKDKAILIMRSSKTSLPNQKPVQIQISADGNEDFDPIVIIEEFTKSRPEVENEDEPLFIFRHRMGISPQQFRGVLKSMLNKSGFNCLNYNCHSLRSGRAKDLKKLGWLIQSIMDQGRWKSNSIFKYLS